MSISWGEIYDLNLSWDDVYRLNLTWDNLMSLNVEDLAEKVKDELHKLKFEKNDIHITSGMENCFENLFLTVNVNIDSVPKAERKWTKQLIEIFVEAVVAVVALALAESYTLIKPVLCEVMTRIVLYIEVMLK